MLRVRQAPTAFGESKKQSPLAKELVACHQKENQTVARARSRGRKTLPLTWHFVAPEPGMIVEELAMRMFMWIERHLRAKRWQLFCAKSWGATPLFNCCQFGLRHCSYPTSAIGSLGLSEQVQRPDEMTTFHADGAMSQAADITIIPHLPPRCSHRLA